MKKYLFVFLLLIILSCNTYLKEINNKGVGVSKLGYSLKKNYYKTYAADTKYVYNINLRDLGDTISKRCFSSFDLNIIKNEYLYQKRLFNFFTIKSFNEKDIQNCYGLFLLTNEEKITYPIIKLKDTIFMNFNNAYLINNYTNDSIVNYIKNKLLENYIVNDVNIRIKRFIIGGVKEPNIDVYPLR